MRSTLLLLGALPLSPTAFAGWLQVFEDHFEGTSVNAAEWSMYHSPGHNGNGLRRASAFTVADGILTCTAKMVDGQLISGGMAHHRNYRYGKFEFRVRTSPENGTTTSGVVLTWPQSERWPADGENDIYETTTNRDRKSFHTYIHYPNSNGGDATWHQQYNVDASQWRTVAMEWNADSIKIFHKEENAPFRPDEVPAAILTNTEMIPDNPHHLCIQLDAFAKTMTGEVRLEVDWVRIYQWQEEPPSAPSLSISPATPGVTLFTSAPGEWQRQNIRTTTTGHTWRGRTMPVSYEFTIAEHPAESGYEHHLYLVPSSAANPVPESMNDPDNRRPDCARLYIDNNSNGAWAHFGYKTSSPGNENAYWDRTLATLQASRIHGNWRLTFTSDTAFILTAPDGTTAAGVFPEAAAAAYNAGATVFIGSRPMNSGRVGLQSRIDRIAISGTQDAFEETFADASAIARWTIAADHPSGVVTKLRNSPAWWLTWASTPGYELNVSPTLESWAPLTGGTQLDLRGKKWVLWHSAQHPRAFFRLRPPM